MHDKVKSLRPFSFGYPMEHIPVEHIFGEGPKKYSKNEPAHNLQRGQTYPGSCQDDHCSDRRAIDQNILYGVGLGKTFQERVFEDLRLSVMKLRSDFLFHESSFFRTLKLNNLE